TRNERLRLVRCEPTRADQRDAGRPRSRPHPWARLRHDRGRTRAREGRIPPSPRAQLSGARRGNHAGRDPRPRPGSGARARGRAGALASGMREGRLLGESTPERPGPGPLPAELLRALQIDVSRRLESMLAGDFRSTRHGPGTELAQVRPYLPGDDVRMIEW